MAKRGRPAFQPTSEQRQNVEVMAGIGIPEEEICLVVRDRRDKPICRSTLRRHFGKELQTGATKVKAKVGHFMLATILGTRPPDGVTPIRDERVRGRLGELFLKARLGWRETDSNQHEGLKEERPMDVQAIRTRLRAKLDRLAEPERGANSGEPMVQYRDDSPVRGGFDISAPLAERLPSAETQDFEVGRQDKALSRVEPEDAMGRASTSTTAASTQRPSSAASRSPAHTVWAIGSMEWAAEQEKAQSTATPDPVPHTPPDVE
jgi:hypothetical protein